MKNVLIIASLLLSLDLMAMPTFYSANFEITEVKSTCPAGAHCFIPTQKVEIEATLGCGDELKFFEAHIDADTEEIVVASVVKRNPNHQSIKCIMANTVTKEIEVSFNSRPLLREARIN